MRKLILSFKEMGVNNVRILIERATKLRNLKSDNLSLYGEAYRSTLEYAVLGLAEAIELFKCEVIKALFRIK